MERYIPNLADLTDPNHLWSNKQRRFAAYLYFGKGICAFPRRVNLIDDAADMISGFYPDPMPDHVSATSESDSESE